MVETCTNMGRCTSKEWEAQITEFKEYEDGELSNTKRQCRVATHNTRQNKWKGSEQTITKTAAAAAPPRTNHTARFLLVCKKNLCGTGLVQWTLTTSATWQKHPQSSQRCRDTRAHKNHLLYAENVFGSHYMEQQL